MTIATLSFSVPGVVTWRCAELAIDERRALEGEQPFSAWRAAYDAALTSPGGDAALGVAIGRWLDGAQGWLHRLLAQTIPPLVLEVEVTDGPLAAAVLAAPWELLAIEDHGQARSLAIDATARLGPVRRLGPAGTPRPAPPHRLSVLCMAALPDGRPGLDVARRDCEFLDGIEALDATTRALGVELAVEESGAADGLARVALARQADVIQLVGELQVDPPGLVLEVDRDGDQRVVTIGATARAVTTGAATIATAAEFQAALAGQVPGLLVLPTPTSAAAARAGEAIAATLCRQGWPAVLAWSAPITDAALRGLVANVYRHLAARGRLDQAVADARASSEAWHRARLFLGPAGGDRLVSGSAPRDIRIAYSPTFLDAAQRVAVWKPSELFGYRGVVQTTVAALRRAEATAVAIHGAGARLRASLAARAAAALDDRRRVVIARRRQDRAEDLLDELARTVANAEVDRQVRAYLAQPASSRARLAVFLRQLLEGPCQRAKQGAVLLVLHDLRLRRARARAGEVVLPGASPVVTEVIEAFHGAATESRLLVTSASRFAVYTVGGVAVAGAVRFAPEAPIAPAALSRSRSRAKKVTTTIAGVCALALLGVIVTAAAGALDGAEGTYRIARSPLPALYLISALATAALAWLARRPVSPRAALGPGRSVPLLFGAIVATAPMLATIPALFLSPTARSHEVIDAAVDAARLDAGLTDAANPDAATDAHVDAAPTEAATDAAPADARPTDARPIDARPTDARPIDARPTDARPIDARPIDASPIDASPIDATPIDALMDSTPLPIDADAKIIVAPGTECDALFRARYPGECRALDECWGALPKRCRPTCEAKCSAPAPTPAPALEPRSDIPLPAP